MRALICDDFGGIDALRVGEMPDPVAGPGQVVVRVATAVVNFADTLMVSGLYQLKPEPPFSPGYELSGVVVEAGEGSGFSPGDRVCAYTPFGAMAEMVAVPAENCDLLPDSLGFDEAASLPGTYGTSYHALVDRANLQAGETLLVLGAAGGVGLAAVQIGKALGAKVIAAVSSDPKAEMARSSGADEIIRYDQEELRAGIDRLTDRAGVDVVFDAVGGDATEVALRSTRWNGRLLVVGFAAGEIPRIPLNLTLLKGNSIVGVFWGRFTNEEPERSRENRRKLMEMAASGVVTPRIGHRFTLDEGAAALRMVAGREAVGRVVIKP
ncbi:MAG: NADPH:quinone oxidoreductase family protein [Actinomycetes bacterium]|jgi:NADPH2:quinone reductase|nr:MAG: NADPH:quinone oxidoreductase [Actinomycetota bacterium]